MKLAVLTSILILSILLSTLMGPVNVFELDQDLAKKVLLEHRIPRAILASLVGASLAASGCAMQAFFRNPLADPYILGVSSGASVGAALAITLGFGTTYGILISAFVTSILTALTVYRLGRRGNYAVLLSGIAVASFLSGITTLIIYFSQNSLHEVFFWIMGSFSRPSWEKVIIVFSASLLCSLYLLTNVWNLNAILLGDEHARSLGLNVEKFRKNLIVTTSFLTSSCVSCCGVIGFVGIIVPHTMRLIFGEAHQRLLPTSLMFGMTIMPLVDLISRSFSGELPVGAITAIIGAPFFIYLIRKI